MAQVVVKVLGGSARDEQAGSVGELKRKMGLSNHQANVNGSSATDSFSLSDNDFVTLSPSVKGGM